MKITYYVHDLSFPLVEGVRKQAWMLATAMHKKGHRVNIVSTSKKRATIVKEGIKIQYGSPFQISRVKTEILHYISHPSPLIVPLLFRARAKKQIITMYDGALNGFWKRWWDPLLSSWVRRKVRIITLQTFFQKKIIQKTRLKHIPTVQILPLIPLLRRSAKQEETPTLLFMSHLSTSKGIKETLIAFAKARKKIKNLRLVICDSRIQRSTKYHRLLKRIGKGDIVVKQKVDPQQELSQAWVYLYPLHRAQETFSIPLSLIEAIQVGTPYISTTVGAIPDYFQAEYLVRPRNSQALAQKIVEIIGKKKHHLQLRSEIDNKKVVEQFLQLYHNRKERK